MYPLGPRAEFRLHRAQRLLYDTAHGPAPTRMHRRHRAMLLVHQQDGNAIGGLHRHQVPGRVFEQPIPIAQQACAATRRHADIGMDLMQRGQLRIAGQLRCMACAEAMLQPRKPFERTRAIDILGILVEHYAGF